MGWVSAAAVAVLAGFAVWGGGGYDPLHVDYARAGLPPSLAEPFGTDPAGRSVFAATAAGLRVSLWVAVAAAATATLLGVLVGAVAGLCGGVVDRVLMRVVDVSATVPHLLAGLVIVAFFRGSLLALVIAVGLTHWPAVARLVRAVLSPLHGGGWVLAAMGAGYRRRDLALHHLIPAAAAQAGIAVVLLVPGAIAHEAALSFLGVGLPPHRPSLGVQLNQAQQAVYTGAWWQVAAPAAALVAVTVAVTVTVRRLLPSPAGDL